MRRDFVDTTKGRINAAGKWVGGAQSGGVGDPGVSAVCPPAYLWLADRGLRGEGGPSLRPPQDWSQGVSGEGDT